MCRIGFLTVILQKVHKKQKNYTLFRLIFNHEVAKLSAKHLNLIET